MKNCVEDGTLNFVVREIGFGDAMVVELESLDE